MENRAFSNICEDGICSTTYKRARGRVQLSLTPHNPKGVQRHHPLASGMQTVGIPASGFQHVNGLGFTLHLFEYNKGIHKE